MVMSSEGREVIHFLWLIHTPNQAIFSELLEGYGTDVITFRTVENCTIPNLLTCPGSGNHPTLEMKKEFGFQ
jgi:hypothetical protein